MYDFTGRTGGSLRRLILLVLLDCAFACDSTHDVESSRGLQSSDDLAMGRSMVVGSG
jgi:hypothetical protein